MDNNIARPGTNIPRVAIDTRTGTPSPNPTITPAPSPTTNTGMPGPTTITTQAVAPTVNNLQPVFVEAFVRVGDQRQYPWGWRHLHPIPQHSPSNGGVFIPNLGAFASPQPSIVGPTVVEIDLSAGSRDVMWQIIERLCEPSYRTPIYSSSLHDLQEVRLDMVCVLWSHHITTSLMRRNALDDARLRRILRMIEIHKWRDVLVFEFVPHT